MSYRIITDSACNLPEEIINAFQLEILPLIFTVDGVEYKSYLKGQTTDLGQFYTMMREGKHVQTSLPHLDEAEGLMREILDAGDDFIYLGFSSALSGTYNACELLIERLRQEYPERTLLSEETLSASGGEGLVVYLAAQQKEAGLDIHELARFVRETRLKVSHWFTVDDLMFLFRGGRVSKTSAWAGTMLKIKPVLHVDDQGRLIPQEKIRGRKKAIKSLVEHMKQTVVDAQDQTIFITHGDCLDDALYLQELIQKEFGCTKFVINIIDPVIGAHSGPGTLALFFVGKHRN